MAATMLSLVSCQKENLESTANGSAKAERIISGAFTGGVTKTTLGTNDTPLWSVGDVIRVLDGTAYQDVTLVANGSTPGTNEGVISTNGKSFSFATTLTGTSLFAVYPASATTMTSCTDGNITFTVPAIQDGSFASANICVASGDGSTANTIYFSNATAVVEMTVDTDVIGTKFAATNNVAGDMTVTMGAKGVISGTIITSLSSTIISVSDTKAPTGSKFYLAVAPVETGAVTITCNTTSKSGSTGKTTKTLAKDKIYAMDLSGMTIDADFDLTGQHGVQSGVEYVLIKAQYKGTDDSYLKWATQNLAVTTSGKQEWKPNGTSTGYIIGDYFQWAAYDGYVSGTKPENLVIYTSFTNTFTSSGYSFSGWKDSKTFTQASAPYGGSSYTKYTSTDSKTTLEKSDDVANIVLGSTWRIPTGGSAGEFKAMRAVTYWAWDATDKGCYVFKPGVGTSGSANGRGTIAGTDDKTKALLFFPAAGYGNGTGLSSAGLGYYWSSTLRSDFTDCAYSLYFLSSYVIPENNGLRCSGFSVRPVSD